MKVPAEQKEGDEIVRNPGELALSTNDQKNAGIIIVVKDLEFRPVMVGEAAFGDVASD